ncbi:hypothetical protein FDE94_14980 [Clostridium botulinum]|nr:hypothetical protein [Clostridium botulinum]
MIVKSQIAKSVINILIEKEFSYSEAVEVLEIAKDQLKYCKLQNSNIENKTEVENLVQEIFNRELEAQQSVFGDILSKSQHKY